MNNQCVYTPAIGIQMMSYWHNKENLHNGYDLKFFGNKSMFQYRKALISAFYGMQHNVADLREKIGWDKKDLMILDSGGFEASTQNIPIDPIKTLRWMENNGDILMNLDIPYPQKSAGLPTEQEFNSSLKASSKNFAIFEKNRKNHDVKIYNILHGESWDYMNTWFNEVNKYNFDGWASGLKPSGDIYQQALGFCFLYEKGVLDDAYGLHFFGMSGNKIVPIIAHITNKYLKNLVTFDSSTYNLGAIFRTYFVPLKTTVSNCLYMGDNFEKKNPWLGELPCNCPVCSNTSIEELNGTELSYEGTLISLHNLWNTVHYVKCVNAYINNPERLHAFLIQALGQRNANQVMECIKFIDYTIEKGTKKGFEIKKQHYLSSNKSKQHDLTRF